MEPDVVGAGAKTRVVQGVERPGRESWQRCAIVAGSVADGDAVMGFWLERMEGEAKAESGR